MVLVHHPTELEGKTLLWLVSNLVTRREDRISGLRMSCFPDNREKTPCAELRVLLLARSFLLSLNWRLPGEEKMRGVIRHTPSPGNVNFLLNLMKLVSLMFTRDSQFASLKCNWVQAAHNGNMSGIWNPHLSQFFFNDLRITKLLTVAFRDIQGY